MLQGVENEVSKLLPASYGSWKFQVMLTLCFLGEALEAPSPLLAEIITTSEPLLLSIQTILLFLDSINDSFFKPPPLPPASFP